MCATGNINVEYFTVVEEVHMRGTEKYPPPPWMNTRHIYNGWRQAVTNRSLLHS